MDNQQPVMQVRSVPSGKDPAGIVFLANGERVLGRAEVEHLAQSLQRWLETVRLTER